VAGNRALKDTDEPKNGVTATDPNPFMGKRSDANVINAADMHYLEILSPELQDVIRQQKQILLLPDWPEKTRGVPNLCLRSALFGIIRRGRRRAVKGDIIAAIKGLEIRYTGWQLDQGDFDVMAQTLHLQKHQRENTSEKYVRFRIKTFLCAIGRQSGKSGRDWLKDSFRRLTATALEISIEGKNRYLPEKYGYAGSLIDEFYYNDQEHTYLLKINPKLAELFDAGWTRLQWQQRLQLRSDLAKWLHGFYASHRDPFPIKVSTLKHLCGSDCKRLVDFRRGLRMAMQELISVEAIGSWEIDATDKVHVCRSAKYKLIGGHSSHTQGA